MLAEDDRPLRVDWLDAAWFSDGLPGPVGLTYLPGKHGASSLYPGRIYRRDLQADLDALRSAGVRRLMLLIQDHELARWGDPGLVEIAAQAGIEVIRHPMPDGGVPASAAAMDVIVSEIDEERARGGGVAVACLGGVGRTGTVAACVLVRAGYDPDDAIAKVRATRNPYCVESPNQQAFVRDYAERLSA